MLSDDYWTYFVNGPDTERHKIMIKRRTSGLIVYSEMANGNKIVEFINDNEITITYYAGPGRNCQDCSFDRFIRAEI